MSRRALKKMITKFQDPGELGVLPKRGRKRLTNETAEEVALTDVERALGSPYSSTSARAVSRDLSLPWSTVREVICFIIKWYSYKIHVAQSLNSADPEKCTQFPRIVWPE
ncbi:hypothetical protein AVEN_97754-1 [Araneus ventricosus]|uniref:DUF4817 domain-containing protein n=1 Tax=Araneus ventricosus TaxID=182803 RepID=A0A4Y2E3T7_ARAVE|nr:hypothetical protein AVEN_97754-1 [Araneus ventricosus]